MLVPEFCKSIDVISVTKASAKDLNLGNSSACRRDPAEAMTTTLRKDFRERVVTNEAN